MCFYRIYEPPTGQLPTYQILASRNQSEVRRQPQHRLRQSLVRIYHPSVRGSNNDTDKNKYKDRFDSLKRGSIPVEGFIPSNEGERLCHVIALEIDESYMDFLLSVLRKDGDEFL